MAKRFIPLTPAPIAMYRTNPAINAAVLAEKERKLVLKKVESLFTPTNYQRFVARIEEWDTLIQSYPQIPHIYTKIRFLFLLQAKFLLGEDVSGILFSSDKPKISLAELLRTKNIIVTSSLEEIMSILDSQEPYNAIQAHYSQNNQNISQEVIKRIICAAQISVGNILFLRREQVLQQCNREIFLRRCNA